MNSLKNSILGGIEELNPGLFAFVMATGIVSIAAHGHGMEYLSAYLLTLSIVAYISLGVLTFTKVLRFPRRVLEDVLGLKSGPAFFTIVPATCVLGSQFVVIAGDFAAGRVLWTAGMVLWILLLYAFFTSLIVAGHKPVFEKELDGSWLIYVVGTQAISILGALAAPSAGQPEMMLFPALAFFLAGSLLYMVFITLIVYRLVFFKLEPGQFTPSYWIAPGAAAITTLAGATLIANAVHWPLLQEILPFIKGTAFLFWSVATGWIPVLLVLAAWRHLCRDVPVRYDVQDWSMVFPIGMYADCTLQLAKAAGFGPLISVSWVLMYVAIAAWLAVFLGLLRWIASSLIERSHPE